MNTASIVCGSPGAGKTTYGQRLARKQQATFLDIDTVTERMVRAGMAMAKRDPDDRDSSEFKQTFREPIYETLFDIALENLQWVNVVITGPFTREIRDPNWPSQLSKRLRCSVEVHYVYCSPEVRQQRLISRGNPRDRAKLADWNRYIQYYGSETPPDFPHIFVDTSQHVK